MPDDTQTTLHTEHPSLRRDEARARADLLDVTSYDVSLDLTDERTFASRTRIRFTSRGGPTFVDVRPVELRSAHLDGQALPVGLLERGRLPIETAAGEHELVVDAVMPFRHDGEGLHRSTDPADGRDYVYAMSFMEAAPTIFACFDQPDLKAIVQLRVRTPHEWTLIANGAATEVEPGLWECAETPPLSTYFVTLVAGPWHVITGEHDGIPLGLSARQSLAGALDAEAEELFTLTGQSFDELHRLFGSRYAFGHYHQAFVPEFNAGAMENPGCVTFRDQLVFDSRVVRTQRLSRAKTLAHEMAHQWFGNLVTPQWWDDLWLNESFAEYMGNRVTADATEYADAWAHQTHVRHQWGLLADSGPATHPVAGNGAVDARSALQDFDGISYVKGSSVLRQLAGRMGDGTFFGGLADLFERHRFGNATMQDLVACWERAGADLGDVEGPWLRTPGVDLLTVDRSTGDVTRAAPAAHPADRRHALHVAVSSPDGSTWQEHPVTATGDRTAIGAEVPADAALLVDPRLETWALTPPDATTASLLPRLLPQIDDPVVRAGIWSALRTGFELGAVSPEQVVAVAEATLPTEPSDAVLGFTVHASDVTKMLAMEWLTSTVAPTHPDPEVALRRIHDACLARLTTSEPGGVLQLAAAQGAIASATDTSVLQAWLDGDLPPGLVLDSDLRWRVLIAIASRGGLDREALDSALAESPSTAATVAHARAVASLPDPDAKAWAWERWTGAAEASAYELQACGQGFWQPHQTELTQPWVERYLAEVADAPRVHQGWVLADAVAWFFPITAPDRAVVSQVHAVADRDDVEPVLARTLRTTVDALERRLRARDGVER